MSTGQTQTDGPSKARRLLVGCAVSLGAVVVLFVLLAFAGYWWVSTPGPQIDSEWFIGPETVGVIHLDRPFEDEGVIEFVGRLALEVQEKQVELTRRNAPPWVGQLNQFFGPDQQDIERDLKKDAPRQVTVILEAVEGSDRPWPGAVLNLNRFPRLLRFMAWTYSAFADNVTSFRGFDLVPFERGAFSFVEDTLVWSRNPDALRQILMRLERLPESRELRSLHPPGEGFADPRWDAYGRVENRAGSVDYLLDLWARFVKNEKTPLPAELSEDFLSSLEALDLGLDLQPGDKALLSVHIRSQDEQERKAWRSLMESMFAELASQEDSVVAQYRFEQRENLLGAELELAGLRERIMDRLVEMLPAEEPSGEPR